MKMGQDFRNKFVLNKNLGFKTPGVIQNEREIPQDNFSVKESTWQYTTQRQIWYHLLLNGMLIIIFKTILVHHYTNFT